MSPYTLACNLTEALIARYDRAYAEAISGMGSTIVPRFIWPAESPDKYSTMDEGHRWLRVAFPGRDP